MIQTAEVSITYKGDGVQTSFPYPYPYRNSADIIGYIINDIGYETRITTNFKYDEVSNTYQYPLSGEPLSSSYSIKLIRETPQQQNAALPSKLPFSLIEKSLDWIIMILQEIGSRSNNLWNTRNDCKLSETNARNSASAAANSEDKAATSATEAALSEDNARTSEKNAKASETKVATSAQNAKISETNAKSSETKAAVSANNAKTSETNAKTSERTASDSASASASSASAAATSATNAKTSETNAAESARVATENAMDFNMLKRNKAYAIGDIAYSSYLPSWARLECVKTGITGATVPPALGTTQIAGQYITDGTVIFILDDVRDGNRVGDIVLKPTLNDGYIKANGATVKASEYSRLLKFAQTNSLCVSDSEWMDNSATKYVYDASADTLKVPNAMGRVLQGAEMLATREAGLPNFEAAFNARDNVARNTLGCFDGATGGCVIKNIDHNAVIALAESITYGSYEDRVYLNANYYNSIYGSSTTVQPPACCMIAQIKY